MNNSDVDMIISMHADPTGIISIKLHHDLCFAGCIPIYSVRVSFCAARREKNYFMFRESKTRLAAQNFLIICLP